MGSIICVAAHDGPLNRRLSHNPYPSASRTITAAIDFPARILSGRLRITLRKMTQRMAAKLIAALYRPKCHGPRSISRAAPLARHERYTGITYERYSPIVLIEVTIE